MNEESGRIDAGRGAATGAALRLDAALWRAMKRAPNAANRLLGTSTIPT